MVKGGLCKLVLGAGLSRPTPCVPHHQPSTLQLLLEALRCWKHSKAVAAFNNNSKAGSVSSELLKP